MEAATSVLEHRPGSYRFSPVWDPFHLGVLQLPYRQMIAQYLRSGPQRFVLSGWGDLDGDADSRTRLASLVETGDFSTARHSLPDCRLQIERLEALDAYFNVHTTRWVDPAPMHLEDHVAWLGSISNDVLGGQHQEVVGTLIDGQGRLDESGVSRSNRSDIRRAGPDIIGPDVFEGLLAFYDTCYNATLSDSLGSQSGVWGAASRNPSAHELVGEELAIASMNHHAGAETPLAAAGGDDARLEVWVDPTEAIRREIEPAASHLGDVWELVTADDDWRRSAESLQPGPGNR
ncbi:MAG: hypothetical protein ACLFWM_09735 [Actinomycetota bacterium]